MEDGVPLLLSAVVIRPDCSFSLVIIGSALLLALLASSALLSGSEAAYLSLSPSDVDMLKSRSGRSSKVAALLLQRPDHLLSGILLANNVVNVAIIVLSMFLMQHTLVFASALCGYAIEVAAITFILLLCGEVLPKIYTRNSALSVAVFMALPLYVLSNLTKPFGFVMAKAALRVNRRLQSKHVNGGISIDDLSGVLDVMHTNNAEDKKILKGIVKLSSTDVRKIMTPRIDVVAVDVSTTFAELHQLIVKWEYSRLPVYEDSFDNVKGVLYIKDLLRHLGEADFAWQTLVRPAYFVPENKKINDLLEEFQTQKNHLAVVVDEYGGALGIATLEDILEEIVGEISDESDMEELPYKKLSDGVYIFEGKTLLIDFCKLMNLPDSYFDDVTGDSETLAGALLELKGDFPSPNEEIRYKQAVFATLAFEGRRIQKVRVTFDKSSKKS
ncbi:MAG: gliding motility-associated protein GldE [Prevotellaceae bacterium]|nr:gliding motility-associated protein GldE [Prevotellaceae bacterium]